MDSLVDNDWHQNVKAALDLVREEVVKATQQIQESGGAEMAKGNRILARKALDYLDNLDEFMIAVEAVGEKWDGLQRKIMGDAPGVQEIVLPTKVRSKAAGYKRNVKEVAPWTNFTARINGGELIGEKTAKLGFAKALANFDLEKIAGCGVMINGEPLIAKGKSSFKKYPQAVVSIKNGWYATTYCSTAKKVSLLREFAKMFGVKIEINVVPHKLQRSGNEVPKVSKRDTPQPMRGREVKGIPYPVGIVVQAVFPEVFKRHLVTAKDVDELRKIESSPRFKTGGNAVLLLNRGNDCDRYRTTPSGKSYARYYPTAKVRIEFQGSNYYLTSQFSPEAIIPVVEWLAEKGISKEEICRIIEKHKDSHYGASLF